MVVHGLLAQPSGHRPAVRRRPHPHRARVLGALPAPASPAAGGRRLAARARAGAAGPLDLPRRGDAGLPRDVRLPGLLQPRRPDAVGAPPGRRGPPGSRHRAGVDPRVPRAPRFAASPPVVSPRELRPVRRGAARPGAGGARLRRGRPRGRGPREGSGRPRRGPARRERAAARRARRCSTRSARACSGPTAACSSASSSRGPDGLDGARRRGTVRLRYPDGREVHVARGFSVLEASRLAGIPHASVCGGRGRCSTCRVRVDRGGDGARAPVRRGTAGPPARGGAAQRAAGLPAAPDARRRRRSAPAGRRDGARGRAALGVGLGPGAGGRGPVRGHPRVHALRRAAAARTTSCSS